ncbi:MAG: oxidoreductase, partial [Proteiniphilum sp.]|nr:oxidoreductase [Proteiniphilum sp.]
MRYYLFILGSLLMLSCNTPHTRDKGEVTPTFTGQEGEVRLIVLDPGHFHASLLQKSSLPLLNDSVYVYAPDSIGIRQYLAAI